MVAVPSEECAPIADGLRVPKAVGDFLLLDALRASQGTAWAVPDAALLDAARRMARYAGALPSPEAAACLVAQQALLDQGWIGREETVVLFNAGAGLKYPHLF